MTPRSPVGVGNNLVLAAVVALFSFVPFEYVAKISLVVCGILFIFDPFPFARLVAIISVLLVGALARAHRRWSEELLEEEEVEEEEDTTTTAVSNERPSNEKAD